MNKGLKTLLIVGAVGFAGYRLIGAARKATKLADNLYVSPSIAGVKLGVLSSKLVFNVNIRNLSGFNLTVKNLFTKLQFVTDSGPIEIGVSGMTPIITLNNNGETTFSTEFQISNLSFLLNLKKATAINTITFYDFAGQQLSYPSQIDLPNFKSLISKHFGNNTVGNPGIVDLKEVRPGYFSLI